MKFKHTAFGETFDCVAVLTKYRDGGNALLIKDAEDGSPVATASVNLAPEVLTPNNHVWLKTWSENEGIDDSLVRGGIVTLTAQRHIVNHHGSIAILAKLTEKFLTSTE